MKKKIMKQWVAALRSGEFEQTKNKLDNLKGGYCCLGVLCTLALNEGVCDFNIGDDNGYSTKIGTYDNAEGMLPKSVMKWAGMATADGMIVGQGRLTILNDSGVDFKTIAGIIETNWRWL